MTEEKKLLRVTGLGKSFGGIRAVAGYTLNLAKNELVGLIGPNGAGKTTVFNMLSGILKPSSGRIFLETKNITGSSPAKLAKVGIARTFQNIRLFSELSVLDNIKVGCHMHCGQNIFHTVLHSNAFRKSEALINHKSTALAKMMNISHLCCETAKNIPYGDQRRVEIARALATEPRILLLDEPSAGMNSQETQKLMATIQEIHSTSDVSILIVEHDMQLVMNLCQRIQVLNQGCLLTQGTPEEIQSSPGVIEAYLGSSKWKKYAET